MIKLLILCIFSTIVSSTRSNKTIIINGSDLRSLSCLGMLSPEEPCRVLGRAISLPERLLDIYRNQKTDVKDALNSGDLSSLTTQDLTSIHPILLLLIPSAELSWLEGDHLAILLKNWSKEKVIVRHIIFAVSLSKSREMFFRKVENIEFQDEVLDIIGEYIPLDWNSRQVKFLLPHLSFPCLLNLSDKNRKKMLLFLKSRLNSERSEWSQRKRAVLRTWAITLIEADYPKPLHHWADVDFELLGDVLVGAKPSELSRISNKNIADKKKLLSYTFSTLQVRTLFTKLFNLNEFTKKDFSEMEPILHLLLPSQLQRFSYKVTDYRSVKFSVNPKSVASTNQMFQYMLMEGEKKRSIYPPHNLKNDSLIDFGYMVYLMQPSKLKSFMTKPLSLSKLYHLQSKYLTPIQVYYISNMGKEVNTSNEDIKYCSSFLHALPTSHITELHDSNIIYHLALNLPTNNLPRLVKFLYTSHLADNPAIMLRLYKRPDRLHMFSNLPVRILSHHIEKLTAVFRTLSDEFHPAWINLPENMALSMYHRIKDALSADSLSGVGDHLLDNLVYGFTCQEIINLPVPDFIVTISRFRKLINLQSKEFPKDLQQCSAEKLVEYLKLKSYFIQQYINDSLINLLTPTEIDAVGGWILIKLSIDDIKSSEFIEDIVEQIGHMSVSEIIVASDLSKIRDIIHAFLQVKNKKGKIGIDELYKLGNLTMIFKEHMISMIDPKSFKILLEGNVLDTRICSTEAQRNAWKELILQSYGSPSLWTGEEMIFLGDLLIALPKDLLSEIKYDAWIMVADILDTKYFLPVQWHKEAKFYQVCQIMLPQSEADGYVRNIKTLISYYLRVAQMQLDTVKTAQDLHSEFDEPETFHSQEMEPSVITRKEIRDYEQDIETQKVEDSRENAENDYDDYNQSTSTEKFDNILEKEEIISNDKSNTSDNESELSVDNNEDSSEIIAPWKYDSETASENLSVESSNDNQAKSSITSTLPPFVKDEPIGSLNDEYFDNTSETFTPLDNDADESDINSVWRKLVTTANSANETESSSSIHEDNSTEIVPIQDVTSSNYDGSADSFIQHISDQNETLGSTNAESDSMVIHMINFDSGHQKSSNNEGELKNFTSVMENIFKMKFLSDNNEKLIDDLLVSTRDDYYQSESDQNSPINDILSNRDSIKKKEISQGTAKIYQNVTSAFLEAIKALNKTTVGIDRAPISDEMLNPVEKYTNNEKILSKRSLSDTSKDNRIKCDAVRTVGTPAAMVITEDMIEEMSDNELMDCTEIFGSMDLPADIQKSIWLRIDKTNLHLKGRLLRVASEGDLSDSALNVTFPWGLENIYALSTFNSNKSLAQYIMNHAVSQRTRLHEDELVAFGKMLCHLPNLKEMISPLLFVKSAVVLGSSLPCDTACLATFASIASEREAFGDPLEWSSIDVNDLGIIVAGLNNSDWTKMIKESPNILYGLKRNAGACLTESHIKAIPTTDIQKIPFFTRVLINEELKAHSIAKELKDALTLQPKISLYEYKHEYSASTNNHSNFALSIILIISVILFNFYFF